MGEDGGARTVRKVEHGRQQSRQFGVGQVRHGGFFLAFESAGL
jgi:hypothetical protein